MIESIVHDIRYAARSLRRSKGFTAAAVLTLAAGIGLTTAVYSVVDAVLVEPIPLPEHDRLVVVWETDRDASTTREPASYPDFLDLRQRGHELSQLAAFSPAEVNFTPDGGAASRLASVTVSGDFFSLLGVQPLAGRLLTVADESAGAPDVVIISEQLWETRFERAPAAVGQTMRLNGRLYTIAGVAPRAAAFGTPQVLGAAAYGQGFIARDRGADVDVWRPLRTNTEASPRATHGLMLLGRMGPDTSAAAVQQELATIASDLERMFPENQARGINVEFLDAVVIGPVRPALLVLLLAVVFLLLIACVNVANLLLVRAASRTRQIAVRMALGASMWQLVRQFLVESVLLLMVSTAAGVWLATLVLRGLLFVAPAGIPRLVDVSIDGRVLLAAIGASAMIAMVFGLLPVAVGHRIGMQPALRADEGRVSTDGRHVGSRRGLLVGVEVTLAIALVISAGLLLRTVAALRQVDPGFDTSNVTKAEFQLPPIRYPLDLQHFPEAPATHRFNDALLARVVSLPGVQSAALAGNQPLDVGFTNSFVIVGREAEAARWPEISIRRITPGYFTTVRLQHVDGRLFNDSDAASAAPVALLNEAAVERFFPDRDPIGHQVAFWGVTRRIVGVVRNERIDGIASPAPIALYVPLAQAPSIDGTEALVVRASADIGPALEPAIRAIDPELAVYGVQRLDDTVSNSIREQQFLMQLLTAFAAIAVLLAAIGIHGVLTYTIAQRTREIGIRVALGATARDIVTLVLGQNFRVTFIGLGAGIGLGLLLGRSLKAWLYGVSPLDPLTVAAAVGVLGTIAAVSSYVPARRAARIDPIAALKAE